MEEHILTNRDYKYQIHNVLVSHPALVGVCTKLPRPFLEERLELKQLDPNRQTGLWMVDATMLQQISVAIAFEWYQLFFL